MSGQQSPRDGSHDSPHDRPHDRPHDGPHDGSRDSPRDGSHDSPRGSLSAPTPRTTPTPAPQWSAGVPAGPVLPPGAATAAADLLAEPVALSARISATPGAFTQVAPGADAPAHSMLAPARSMLALDDAGPAPAAAEPPWWCIVKTRPGRGWKLLLATRSLYRATFAYCTQFCRFAPASVRARASAEYWLARINATEDLIGDSAAFARAPRVMFFQGFRDATDVRPVGELAGLAQFDSRAQSFLGRLTTMLLEAYLEKIANFRLYRNVSCCCVRESLESFRRKLRLAIIERPQSWRIAFVCAN